MRHKAPVGILNRDGHVVGLDIDRCGGSRGRRRWRGGHRPPWQQAREESDHEADEEVSAG